MISDPNSNIFTKSVSQLWHTASQLWHRVTIVTSLEILVLTYTDKELGVGVRTSNLHNIISSSIIAVVPSTLKPSKNIHLTLPLGIVFINSFIYITWLFPSWSSGCELGWQSRVARCCCSQLWRSSNSTPEVVLLVGGSVVSCCWGCGDCGQQQHNSSRAVATTVTPATV